MKTLAYAALVAAPALMFAAPYVALITRLFAI